MKKTLYLFILFAIASSVQAQKTEIFYLSGTDKDHTVKWDFFCTGGMNSNKWTTIDVPSCWEQQGFGAYNYGHDKNKHDEHGLYKYHFPANKSWINKQIELVFEGVMTEAEVKINGHAAGYVHQGSFYRFQYNITHLIKPGVDNLLEVKVSKMSADTSVNHAEREGDFWVFGGIYRPVYLKILPQSFIERVAIDARADGKFNMDVFAENLKAGDEIVAYVKILKGKKAGSSFTSIVKDPSDKISLSHTFDHPETWNPEFPKLYKAEISIRRNNVLIHNFYQRFGFRTIEIKKNDGIYVNGQKVMMKGVNRHSFWPESGRTLSRKIHLMDIGMMKDMNMNAVRMSHYPPDTEFLDLCDSIGLFVLDELTGWQQHYATPVGKKLVKELVIRDVNHPSIILWDNGNEGGFNKELRTEYGKWDPQNRQVIEPWAKLNGMDTKHYPRFKYVENALNTGTDIFFPTEFLHGLYDGGHGAGLDDYWELMNSKPLAAGGFLWVFSDEGIIRRDWKDSIDTHGNNAPDGILGPYREKEGSYYTIKEIWSPVHFKSKQITAAFDGKLSVINRFLYTNLDKCKFSYELARFTGTFPKVINHKQLGIIQSPKIAAGDSGTLKINLPANWKNYDAIYVTAIDPFGRQINRWSWTITHPQEMASRIVKPTQSKVLMQEDSDYVILSSGNISAKFIKTTGLLAGVQKGDHAIPFNNGPVFVGDTVVFKELKRYSSGNNYVIEINYNKSPECFVKWTMLPGGWLQLEYQFHPIGKIENAGITFSYPENLVTGATLMANGPYHVWKNRLKGTTFGVYVKKYNNTVTGETWGYPEFKGYYANFYAVQVQTQELPFTIVSATNDLFLHLFTPQNAKFLKGSVNPSFPSGNISILKGINAIGTKFSKPEDEGPAGENNEYLQNDSPIKGKVYFKFGD